MYTLTAFLHTLTAFLHTPKLFLDTPKLFLDTPNGGEGLRRHPLSVFQSFHEGFRCVQAFSVSRKSLCVTRKTPRVSRKALGGHLLEGFGLEVFGRHPPFRRVFRLILLRTCEPSFIRTSFNMNTIFHRELEPFRQK